MSTTAQSNGPAAELPSPGLNSGQTATSKTKGGLVSVDLNAALTEGSDVLSISQMSRRSRTGSKSDTYIGFDSRKYVEDYNPNYTVDSGWGHRSGDWKDRLKEKAQRRRAQVEKTSCWRKCTYFMYAFLFLFSVLGVAGWATLAYGLDKVTLSDKQIMTMKEEMLELKKQYVAAHLTLLAELKHIKTGETPLPPLPSPPPHGKETGPEGEDLRAEKVMAEKIIGHLYDRDVWITVSGVAVWIVGMAFLHGGPSVLTFLSGLAIYMCPGPAMFPATFVPVIPVIFSRLAWALPMAAAMDFYQGRRSHSVLALIGVACHYALLYFRHMTSLCVIQSLLPGGGSSWIVVGLSALPWSGMIFMWAGVRLLGFTQIRMYPDGSRTVEKKFWMPFRPDPKPEPKKDWVRTDKTVKKDPPPEKNYAGWVKGSKESITRVSINIPYGKLCRVGFFQILDSATHAVVGMGFPYRGRFITALHVWEFLGRPKEITVRHVCGKETQILTMKHVATFEHETTEEIDDGLAIFTLPPGVKSMSQDKTYAQDKESAVIMYSYMHGDMYVSSALAIGNRHWASTMPGTSGSPVLSPTGGVIGIHTSGAASSNVMVLITDVDNMLDGVEVTAEDDQEEWDFTPDEIKDLYETLLREGKSGKKWKKGYSKNKVRRKLWTNEEYDAYLDNGFSREELRDAALAYWKAHPEETKRTMGFEPENVLEAGQSKNDQSPPSGGATKGTFDPSTISTGEDQGLSRLMAGTPGSDITQLIENLSSQAKTTKSHNGSGNGSQRRK